MRNFHEAAGANSTGNAGAIASFSNGDLLVVNERDTNSAGLGIQLFRLAQENLNIKKSRAYFNDLSLAELSVAIRNDTIFVSAVQQNAGKEKLIFLVFDSDLNLLLSRLIESDWEIRVFDLYADTDGSIRVYGYGQKLISNEAKRYVASLRADGSIIWSKLYGGFEGLYGGSAFLANGELVAGSNKAFFAVARNGQVTWARELGAEWSYTVKGSRYNPGEAMMFRTGSDSGLYYGLRLGQGGALGGQTIGVWCNAPRFSATLSNGHSLLGSQSFIGDDVHLKISEFDEMGRLVKNHMIDNLYGNYINTFTGIRIDRCRYSVHVDAKGNFYLLGVANHQGFFVLRLDPALRYDCGYESLGSNPSPIPEPGEKSIPVQALAVQSSAIGFKEELPSGYKAVCTSCGSWMLPHLKDTTLCSDNLPIVLDARNTGATYFWSDGSTDQTITVQESGTYWVRMVNECDTLVDTVRVSAVNRPQIEVSFLPAEPLPGETVQIVATPDTFSVMNWYTKDTLYKKGASHTWSSDENGVYNFIWEVFDDPSCRTRDSISIKISLVDYYFPTAFSPNGNDLNDTWGPVGSGIETYTVRIFNRWGQIIYEGENRNWDGTFKGKAISSGLYSYIVELNDSDGIRHEHRGTITLLH